MKRTVIAAIIAAISLILISSFIIGAQIPEIRVKEGELIKLKVNAVDDNGDALTYRFSAPLDKNGEWQTEFGDAGEFIANVTVSDGVSETMQEVRIIVAKVNRPPVLQAIEDIVVEEGDTVKISPSAKDPEGGALKYTVSEPVGNDGVWEIGYGDAGEYDIIVTASDQESTVSESFMIIVNDKNRDPIIEDYSPKKTGVSVKENDYADFTVSAKDPDNDKLSYLWKVDGTEVSKESSYSYHPDYDSSGVHEISAELDDGATVLKRTWKVDVEDVNRAPSIKPVADLSVNETDLVKIDFDASDPDGDELEFTVSEPIGDDKEWQTGYDDAGVYAVKIRISDGKLEDSTSFRLTVNNVDRAPLFKKIEDVTLTEGERVVIDLEADDPDGDNITFTAEELPYGAKLEGSRFEYSPAYETVYKPGNWFNRLVNFLHIDKLVYRKSKDFDIMFTVAGKEKSTGQNIKLTVNNADRQPILFDMDPIVVNETSLVRVKPVASDPDNDRLEFWGTEPLDGNLKWQTGYEDAGIYNVTIFVTDGEQSDSKKLVIIVKNENRAPQMQPFKQITIGEGQAITIPVIVADSDRTPVQVFLENAPEGAFLTNDSITYTPPFTAASEGRTSDVLITVVASDGEDIVKQSLDVKVKDSNRLPAITYASPKKSVTVYTNQTVLFKVNASDPEGDMLKYEWKFSAFDRISTVEPVLKRRFMVPGQKSVKIIVSDGKDSITKEWIVNVLEPAQPSLKKAAADQKTAAASQSVKAQASASAQKQADAAQQATSAEPMVVSKAAKEPCAECPECKPCAATAAKACPACPAVKCASCPSKAAAQKKVRHYIRFEIDNRLAQTA